MKLYGLIFWSCVLFIAYVYAGYPLIVAVLARLRRKADVYQDITEAHRLEPHRHQPDRPPHLGSIRVTTR